MEQRTVMLQGGGSMSMQQHGMAAQPGMGLPHQAMQPAMGMQTGPLGVPPIGAIDPVVMAMPTLVPHAGYAVAPSSTHVEYRSQ